MDNILSNIFDSIEKTYKEQIYLTAGFILSAGDTINSKLTDGQRKVVNFALTDAVKKAFPVENTATIDKV